MPWAGLGRAQGRHVLSPSVHRRDDGFAGDYREASFRSSYFDFRCEFCIEAGMRYASRLNSFASHWPGKNRITALDLVERAATVKGLTAVDLNYPDHLHDSSPREFAKRLGDLGLTLNGFAMRYYSEPQFKLGAFTHPDTAIRRKAIDLTKRGIEALSEAGGDLMTLWLGQDGFDYALQLNYERAWQDEIDGIRKVAAHNPQIRVSLEYKPNEPRSFALLADLGTTLLAIKEAGNANLGVTLDFAHVLYADENPAFAAMLVARHAKLLGLHLNDGYGKRDDGLMAASVHLYETLELLVAAERLGYNSAIYFDTFPDASGLDPVAECALNIATVEKLRAVATRLAKNSELAAAQERQDAVAARAFVIKELLP